MTQKNKQSACLTFNDLVNEYALPKSTVYNLIKTQGFPNSIKISAQSVRFRRSEVEAWLDARKKQNEGVQS